MICWGRFRRFQDEAEGTQRSAETKRPSRGAVCSQVDAGSADAESFPGFRRFIIDSYFSRVFSLLTITPRRSEWGSGQDPRIRL